MVKLKQLNKSVELVKQFREDCEKNNYFRLLPNRRPFVHYSHFKNFIMRTKGADPHTIRAYRDQLKSFNFIEIDELDRLYFIFEDSQFYKVKSNGALSKFMED